MLDTLLSTASVASGVGATISSDYGNNGYATTAALASSTIVFSGVIGSDAYAMNEYVDSLSTEELAAFSEMLEEKEVDLNLEESPKTYTYTL